MIRSNYEKVIEFCLLFFCFFRRSTVLFYFCGHFDAAAFLCMSPQFILFHGRPKIWETERTMFNDF